MKVASGLGAHGLVGLCELCQRIGETARRCRSRSLVVAGGLAQAFHRALQGGNVFLVRRRGAALRFIQDRIELRGSLADDRKLGRLIVGNESVPAKSPATLLEASQDAPGFPLPPQPTAPAPRRRWCRCWDRGANTRSSVSTFGFLRLIGLKSKCRKYSNGRPRTATPSVQTTTATRWRSRNASTGARKEKPSGSASPAGFISLSIAGSTVIAAMNAMIMPAPAILPSSETPL